jgi:hypothetical protein
MTEEPQLQPLPDGVRLLAGATLILLAYEGGIATPPA